jgi:hypothetical protein
MSINYIDRSHDEDIIDIVRIIMSQGTMVVETFNESILASLMNQRGTPLLSYTTNRNIKKDFEQWKKDCNE